MDKRIEKIKKDIRKTITETATQTKETTDRIDIMQSDIRARNAEMYRKQFKSLEGGKI